MFHEELWKLPPFIAALTLIGYGLYRLNRHVRREREIEEAHQEAALASARAAGVVDAQGRQLCAVCQRALATDPYPVLAHHDADWRGHRRAQGHGPLYAIGAMEGSKLLCAPHERLLVRKLSELLADVAARRAAFNASVEQELAEWESGKLLAWAATEAKQAQMRLADLGMSGRLGEAFTAPSRQIGPAMNADETPMPSVSTVTLEPREEDG